LTGPIISVRAELVRAAMHFVAKGQAAKAFPERAGIRFEPSLTGVCIISMDDDAMIVLRDPAGECSHSATVRIAPSFFDAARRAQRERKADAPASRLHIGGGEARLAGVAMAAPEIALAYPNWRRVTPERAYGLPPAIDPLDSERVALAAQILRGLDESLESGVRWSGVTDRNRERALATLPWPDSFAVVSPLPNSAATAPWQRPIWTLDCATEARAS